MSQSLANQNSQLKLDFSIDFSLFSQSIRSNFVLIWDTLNKHTSQIQMLKSNNVLHQQTPKIVIQHQKNQSRASDRKMNQNTSLNYSQVSFGIQQQQNIQRNAQVGSNPQQNLSPAQQLPDLVKSHAKQTIQKNQSQKHVKIKQNTTDARQEKRILNINIKQSDKLEGHKEQIERQQQNDITQPYFNNSGSKDNQLMSLIENKILQINDRLQRLQLGTVKQSSNFSKKMNQIYNEVEKNTDVMNKKEGQLKKIQFIIEKLRGELSQFKLKKEAQLMKMSNGGTSNSNSKNQFFDLILQKMQQISNTIPELMLRADFEDYKLETQPQLNKLQRKLNEKVSQQQFEGLVNILGRKKPVAPINGGSIVKKQSQGRKINPQNKEAPQIQQDDQINPIVQFKIVSIEKQIKQIQAHLNKEKQQRQRKQHKISEKIKQNGAKIQNALKQISRSQIKGLQYENFMKNMNQSYNDKFKQVINQIAQTQQEIDKLTNQVKFINYVKPQPSSNNPNPSSELGQPVDTSKLIELQNQINTLKKKINKLALKSQSFKQQILIVRQDFAKDVDVIKLTLQKKCDWESLRKGMHHYEQRIKQLSTYLAALQQSMNDPPQHNESTAAKKGWTCLCCDKDIKQYEGKLGQVKFTSVFPSRYESPRIGGYYKQKQGEKEYKQVFMKHNRRLSQQKSKEELNV